MMKPVAILPDITFSKLEQELKQQTEPELLQLANDQFLAKVQIKRLHLTEHHQQQIETVVGKPPPEPCRRIKSHAPLTSFRMDYSASGIRRNS